MTSGLGAKGDGVTDDTQAINNFISQNSGCAILIIETGTYLVSDTIFVPAGTQLVGVLYSVIMGTGKNFADQANPRPVIQVGHPGDVGIAEISDFVITTTGGSAGAIGIEWNLDASSPGSAGLWDVHVRLGGAKGTNIDAAHYSTSATNLATCGSAFLGIHITPSGSGYFENIYAGLIQTETPYFQPTPIPPAPFTLNSAYGDPSEAVVDAWGLVITRSFNIFVYGAGLYSFFQHYRQDCVVTKNCQNSMVLVDHESSAVYIYQLTTTGTTNMISYPGNVSIALQADNVDGYASTLSLWEANGNGSPGSGSGGNNGSNPGGGGGSGTFPNWNFMPWSNSGAVSETFAIAGGSTTVIPIPTTTTIVTVGTQFVFLDPGGTPATALLPPGITEVNGITPTWTFQIVPPTTGPITFTAPPEFSGGPSFTTVVPSPSTGAIETVTGPHGVLWSMSGAPTGPVIIGTLPTSIGISDGITPTPVMPVGWLGPWTDPIFPFTTTIGQPAQSNTDIPWNPNPFPPPGATSETFVCSGTTTSFPIPTATTTISAGGATITLNSGGTPVGGPLATQCSEVGGIIPTWSQDIIPPPGATQITFTGPLTSTPTYISIVSVPPKTDSPHPTVTGPPGDHNRCNTLNIWAIIFGGFINPCLPLDIGIIHGLTPVPIPPPDWKGPWTNPIPRPTPPPPGGQVA
ncbi:Glucan 1,3-beta-glucosidase [Mycena indigotica]|uniref:Glucan 1,3-beta-glucosidase n=1 Tax=Mycena indigotica TaxID=2126181 RepID=A0A8H6T9P8_9AGAR|nr:Glucan 1,3-beta-glucosidase [Mycena indigotica]KAF7311920.1 Glucan 1,3-beta-glucosidase [Mycena indigotica]